MQRLSLAPQRRALTLRVKETGTPVDFSKARVLNLQAYMFRDDVFGIYAYQGAPITVDAAIRDSLLNGNLADLLNQAAGQGMQIQYIRISWNETAQAGKYYITDLVVGAVAKVTRDFNTGPAYLTDALKAVGWYNQMISKMYMPWQAWLLLIATRTTPYKTCQETSISDWKGVSKPIGTPLPDLPTAETVKAQLLQEGKFSAALGEFAVKLLDKGYTITVLSYQVQVCFEKTVVRRSGYYWFYQYRLHVRFSWDFTSNPDFTVTESLRRLEPFTITAVFLLWVIGIIVAGAIAGIIAYNLTHKESGYIEWEVLRDAQGNPIFDEEGNPIIVPKKQGWESGPPEWWSDILTYAVIGGLIIIGTVFVLPPIIKSFRGKKE